MSDASNIEWTDSTWNVVTGCTKVSPGCANCYIERTPPFRIHGRKFDHGHIPLELHENRLEAPLHWKKPRRVFVNSLSDLFHEHIPDAFIDRVFAVMALTPQHTYQILTKRPQRMREYLSAPNVRQRVSIVAAELVGDPAPEMVVRFWPLLNVWIGTSVENQHFAEERIGLLLQTLAAVRFISAEPLLGDIDITQWLTHAGACIYPAPGKPTRGLDWVIVGGESGAGARPFDIAWARSIVHQCKGAGVAVFVKQLGENAVSDDVVPSTSKGFPLKDTPARSGRRLVLSKKGGNPDEWPSDLRVREFPKTVNA